MCNAFAIGIIINPTALSRAFVDIVLVVNLRSLPGSDQYTSVVIDYVYTALYKVTTAKSCVLTAELNATCPILSG